MTFAWHGFRFEIAEDWAPVTLTGSDREGYARLCGPGDSAIQVRWKETKSPRLEVMLDRYLESLNKGDLQSTVDRVSDDELQYHWKGAGQGRGAAFYLAPRVYFLEATGGRRAQLLPLFRAARGSFEPAPNMWSVFGLKVKLPKGYRLEKHTFQAARTELRFSGGLHCVRWGFAEQLLKERTLVDWAKKALDMPGAATAFGDEGIRLTCKTPVSKCEALVRLETEQNQIVTIVSRKVRPEWAWLA